MEITFLLIGCLCVLRALLSGKTMMALAQGNYSDFRLLSCTREFVFTVFAMLLISAQMIPGGYAQETGTGASSGPVCSDEADREAYRKATIEDTSRAYREYLALFPYGCFAELARDSSDDRKDDEDWEIALRQNTVSGFTFYIDKHAEDGKYVEKALEAIVRLEQEGGEPAVAQRQFQKADGQNLYGVVLESGGATNAEACEANCAGKPACQGFSFHKSRKSCTLFSEVNGNIPNADFMMGTTGTIGSGQVAAPPVTTPQPQPPQTAPAPPTVGPSYLIAGATDLPGFDLASYKDVSVMTCEQRCTQLAQCRAYTYNLPNNFCFLKSGFSQRDRNTDAYSGIKQ